MELYKVDLNKLATFLVIAESGSVTAAAARLSITRSAVSHALRTIEADLGVALFFRVGKSLVLTPEGRSLERVLGEVRTRLGDVLDDVRGRTGEVRGPVRVGVFLGFSRFRLAAAISRFAAKHPAAEVRVSFGPESWLLERLLSGKLDLTLSLRPTGERATRVVSEELASRPLVLATKRKRPSEPLRSFDALARLAFVDYYRSLPLLDVWTKHHFGGRVVPRERIRAFVATTDLALELVVGSGFAAVMPRDVVVPFVENGRAVVHPGPDPPLLDPVFLNYLGGAHAGRAGAAFREILLEAGNGRRKSG